MSFHWTERQFVGGTLCLDFTNTVIYPADPERRFDRLATAADLEVWIASALRHAPLDAELLRSVAAATPSGARGDLHRARTLRDATDRLFRSAAGGHTGDVAELLQIAAAYGEGSRNGTLRLDAAGFRVVPSTAQGRTRCMLAAVAQSALSLALSPEAARIRTCANCGWLFVDRSNNRLRRWCDMKVCGNRAKARRHYERQRQA